MNPRETLRHHVTGAIERGEKEAVVGKPATPRAIDLPAIWIEAKAAAQKAADTENARLGAENSRGLDCGFAWIVFDPAVQPISNYLKGIGIADKYHKRGRSVWYSNVHDVPTQSVSVHEAACRAAAVVLQNHGAKCYVSSRLD